MTWNNSIVCFGTRYKPSVGGLSPGLLYADDMKLVVGFALLVYVTLLSLLYKLFSFDWIGKALKTNMSFHAIF